MSAVNRLAHSALPYCGRAVVGFGCSNEQTTDHWIAEELCGAALEVAPLSIGTPEYRKDLGLALRSLRSALETDSQFKEQGVEIGFCGLQWQRGRINRGIFPADGWIAPAGCGRYDLSHSRSRVLRGAPHSLQVTGGNLPEPEALLASLAETPAQRAAEDLLVDAIRDAASRSDLIGSDCMVVGLGAGGITVRYEGVRPTVGPEPVPGTPLPWIVTPGTVLGPMVSRSPELTAGGIPVFTEIPAADVEGTIVAPGRPPGSVQKRYRVPLFGPSASLYGQQPPPRDYPP